VDKRPAAGVFHPVELFVEGAWPGAEFPGGLMDAGDKDWPAGMLSGVQGDIATNAAADNAVGIGPGEFLPLRALAAVLIVLLAGTVALAAATLAVPLAHLNGPAWQIAIDIRALVVSSRVSAAGTVIVFLVWFRRARINAERLGWRQRRALAWTLWGWVIPIACLWIPFQLMGDIWRAGLPPARRSRIAWLPALWWVSWLLAMPPMHIRTGKTTQAWFGLPPYGWLSFACYAIAGLTLIAIIRTVSAGPAGSRGTQAGDPFSAASSHLPSPSTT
jgi:hypothetical protein